MGMDFEELLSEYESLGYDVERVNRDSAVVHNSGVETGI